MLIFKFLHSVIIKDKNVLYPNVYLAEFKYGVVYSYVFHILIKLQLFTSYNYSHICVYVHAIIISKTVTGLQVVVSLSRRRRKRKREKENYLKTMIPIVILIQNGGCLDMNDLHSAKRKTDVTKILVKVLREPLPDRVICSKYS